MILAITLYLVALASPVASVGCNPQVDSAGHAQSMESQNAGGHRRADTGSKVTSVVWGT